MADYPFKINITTKDGTKKSFFTASLATNADTVVSSSVMVDRINNMFSASSFIESIEAPSLTSTKYNNASEGIKFLSASVTHPNTGSIIFTDKETSDNGGLDHYEFYGTKVCSVLGLPEGVPVYTENFKLSDSSTDTTNYISGEFISDRIALKKGFKMSPQARVQSNLVWDHAFGEGFVQWVSGSTSKMSMGYDNVNDQYKLSAPTASVNRLEASSIVQANTLGEFSGTRINIGTPRKTSLTSIHIGDGDLVQNGATINHEDSVLQNIAMGCSFNISMGIRPFTAGAGTSVNSTTNKMLMEETRTTYDLSGLGGVTIRNVNESAWASSIPISNYQLLLQSHSEVADSFAGIAFQVGDADSGGLNDVDAINGAIAVLRDDTTNNLMDGNMIFATNDEADDTLTERMRITHDGLVGIANNNPSTTLDITGTLNVSSNITTGGTVDGIDIAGSLDQAVKTTSSPTFEDITISDLGTFAGGINVGATTDPGTDNMIVAGTSVFGRDTSTNDFTMQVYNGNDDGIVLIRDDSSATDNEHMGAIAWDSRDGGTTTSTLAASAYILGTLAESHSSTNKGGDIRIGTKAKGIGHGSNATERMRITSEGDIGIGTGGDPGNHHRLEVIKSTTGGEAAIVSFKNSSTDTNSSTPKEVLELKHGTNTVNGGLRHITMRQSNGTLIGLVSGDPVVYGNFTGIHMSQNNLTDAQITGSWIPGMIVKSNGNIIGSGSYLSEALPEVELTTTQKDKAVMGVYSHVELPDQWRDMDNSKGAIAYNALGEGRVLVTDTNGNIDTGDYICSSNREGHGEKQDDDILHNYTVAKATQPIDFSTVSVDSDLGYKSILVACTYHCG